MSAVKFCSLEDIVSWKRKDIGYNEENVKIKVIVPLLMELGHKITQLDFEHNGIDIFLKDLPPECRVIVETKNLSGNIEKHLPQLRRYANQANALFSVISNGEQIRIYAFPYDIPVFSIQRKELSDPSKYELLKKFLSRKNLNTKKSLEYLYEGVRETTNVRIQEYKDLATIDNETLRRYMRGEHIGEETKMSISNFFKSMNEIIALENLVKLQDKLRKLITTIRF